MSNVLDFVKSDTFLIVLSVVSVILLIGFVYVLIQFSKLNKRYKDFMEKLGNGKDIEEDLENYMYRVKRVEDQNANILFSIDEIKKDILKCIKKVGIVRYSAFDDTGSDLSFTVALLNENEDGVVLNGIYSREMSNIYAKPVEKGKSTYTLSEEEKEAIKRATQK